MVVDLDELQSAYESKCDALQQQLEEQRTAMDNMRDQLTWQFEQQLTQLELKMNTNNKQLFYKVMNKIENLIVDRNEMNTMIGERMNQILQAINGNNSGDNTPTIGNTPTRPHKTACPTPSPAPTTTPMNIDQPTQADGSLPTNPSASHANHTYDGSNASAGAYK